MSNIDKQALNQEKIEWLNKLADMEYCKSNPGHWLMSLRGTNMLAKLSLRSAELLSELEAAEKRIAELEARQLVVKIPAYVDGRTLGYGEVNHMIDLCVDAFERACHSAGINLTVEG